MTELIWDGKYKDGKKVAPVRIPLPFQTIETVNESTEDRKKTIDLFASGKPTEWRKRQNWGNNTYDQPSLHPEFAGNVNLIHTNPPFNVGADLSTASIMRQRNRLATLKTTVIALVVLSMSVNVLQSYAQWVQTNAPTGSPVYSLVAKGSALFASTGSGEYRSTDFGVTWSKINTSPFSGFSVMAVNGNYLFAWDYNSTYRSSDNGITWTQIDIGGGVHIGSLGFNGASMYAGTMNYGVYLSTNSGNSWTAINNGLLWTNITDFAFNGSTIFAGSANSTYGSIYRSTNGGANWDSLGNGSNGTMINSLVVNDSGIFAGTDRTVCRSTNNGSNWIKVNNGLPSANVYSLIQYGTNLFAGTDNSNPVFVTTNNGSSWTNVNNGLPSTSAQALAIMDTVLFMGTRYHGIWKRILSQMVPIELTSFTGKVIADYIHLDWDTESETDNYGFEIQRRCDQHSDWVTLGFVKGSGTSQSRRSYSYEDPLSQLPSLCGIIKYRLKQIDNDGTASFSPVVDVLLGRKADNVNLSCNYPNPLSCRTTISYSIRTSGHVRLRILNALGENIETIADGDKSAGSYSEIWDTHSMKCGVYFCELKANGSTILRKMLVTK